MIEVGYVVLHYQVVQETIECIESIKEKHGNNDTLIIVVDNASPNGTGKILNDKYDADPSVVVIRNIENLGFAKGLNVGIDYLHNNTNCQFYVLLNNDTALINDDWDYIIKAKYEQYQFAVMGPDIVSLDGKVHNNPSRKQDVSIEGIQKLIKQKKKEYFEDLIYIRPLSLFIRKIVKSLINYQHPRGYIEKDLAGVQLQGSCIILSPKYFEKYEALYRGTFLYFEEAILRYRCEKNNLICMYTPDLKLLHKGSVSIEGNFNSRRKKEIFYYKHSMNSCKAFLNDIISGIE